ncbi:MAG TPA: hypothetical protein VFY78_11290, partial [Gammaproteobacteria bacterium]|nr:hypothetical protein [Gammaproteobacteria bacterium]
MTDSISLWGISTESLARIKKWVQFCAEQNGITQAWMGRVDNDCSIHWVANWPSDVLPTKITLDVSQTVINTGQVFTFQDHEEIISGALFPLIHKGHVVGLVGLLSNQTDYFKPGMLTWINA